MEGNLMAAKTTVVNIHTYPLKDFIYIGRPSIFGNPFTHMPLATTHAKYQCKTREEAVDKYLDWFIDKMATDASFSREIEQLKGKKLGCFCSPNPCHGDIIAHYLNNDEYDPVEEPVKIPEEQLSFFQIRGH